jgi:hypothetical protein
MKKRNASTLLETVLYVALLGIVMGILMTFLINMNRRESKSMAIVEVNENVRFALEKINATVRNSKDATLPTDGTSGTTLTLTMPNAAVSPTVFTVTNGVLTMKEGTAAAQPLTGASVEVASVNFTNLVDPVAHLRTNNTWMLCDKTIWYGVCCWRGAEYCWDIATALWYIIFRGAKAGTCFPTTSAKSVIRTTLTVATKTPAGVANDYWSSVTISGSATVPRQN